MSEWKWTCRKDIIIIIVLLIFGLCLLCFLKNLKKCPDFWKKIRVSSLRNFFPLEPFFGVLQITCLSKCSHFKKHPQGLLPWKIPGYAPDVNQQNINQANVYLIKVNNRNSRKKCHWRCSGVFIDNFEHISHLSIAFLLLNLNKQMLAR